MGDVVADDADVAAVVAVAAGPVDVAGGCVAVAAAAAVGQGGQLRSPLGLCKNRRSAATAGDLLQWHSNNPATPAGAAAGGVVVAAPAATCAGAGLALPGRNPSYWPRCRHLVWTSPPVCQRNAN